MAERLDLPAVSRKWQARWEETGIYQAEADPSREKRYVVTMYPYPSGDLHVGHWYPMTPTDAVSRFLRMQGYNVLYPMGFDAFGLPAENAAIRNNVHPKHWTYTNIRRMEDQLRSMGAGFDWRREIITCDPEYYRWNQWFFLEFLKRGLAYRSFAPVDWCPRCNTTLAREQVLGTDRLCERCSAPVIRKELNQWYLRITKYAEELLQLDSLQWPEKILALQRNWIGKSTGARFFFAVEDSEDRFEVFTTRPDTIFGVTFCVLAPEHPLVEKITHEDRRAEVRAYALQASRQTEIDRMSTEKERTGVFTGAHAVHPLTGGSVPIYVADYVLMGYGTGAIMAVPAHDERDFDFARRYGLPTPVVIAPADWNREPLTAAYTGDGMMVNSDSFDGLSIADGKKAVCDELTRLGVGGEAINYRIRDWLISRQRMWGTPIPIIHCPECGEVPVPEKDLPVVLPDDVEFLPTGESPLRRHDGFRITSCPQCGAAAERETDTMDTFIDSSWYQYRYVSPSEAGRPFDPVEAAYWLPVDLYTGGAEHAVMHLLYSRFFHKVMRDMGLLDPLREAHPERNWDEPFPKLFSQGVITAYSYRDPEGRYVPYSQVNLEADPPTHRESNQTLAVAEEKMSKSKLNVISPDDYAGRYGADVARLFLMFIGPWEQGGPWNPRGVEGIVRFVHRVWTLVTEPAPAVTGSPDPTAVRTLQRLVHQTLRKITHDYERYSFNTAVAALMELLNGLQRAKGTAVSSDPAWSEAMELLVLMLAPIAPHLAEELWEQLGRPYSVHQQSWPGFSEELAADDAIDIVIQVNGKLRDRIRVSPQADEATVREAALACEKVVEALAGKQLRKLVYVPGRLVNLVIG